MWKTILAAAVLGVLPLPFCWCLAEVGHGSNLPVWLFYGPTIFPGRLFGPRCPVAIVLVLIGALYPLYSAVLFVARKRGKAAWVLAGILLIHYGSVAFCIWYGGEDWGQAARAASRQWFSVLGTVFLAVAFHAVAILYATGRVDRLYNPTAQSAAVAVALAVLTAGAFLAVYWSAASYHRANYPGGKSGEKTAEKDLTCTTHTPCSCRDPGEANR